MLEIDLRNFTVPKANLWCREINFGTIQRVGFLDQNSNFSLSYDIIFTFTKV